MPHQSTLDPDSEKDQGSTHYIIRLNKTFETLWRAFHPKPTRISVGSSVVTGLFKSFASFVSRQWAKLRGYKELRATYEVNRSFSSKAFVEGICSPRKWVPRDELETYSYVHTSVRVLVRLKLCRGHQRADP